MLNLLAGGSLTVQIFGSSSPGRSTEDEESNNIVGYLPVSDEQNGFSSASVTVSSRKHARNILKK